MGAALAVRGQHLRSLAEKWTDTIRVDLVGERLSGKTLSRQCERRDRCGTRFGLGYDFLGFGLRIRQDAIPLLIGALGHLFCLGTSIRGFGFSSLNRHQH